MIKKFILFTFVVTNDHILQSACGLAWSVLLSTMIRIIAVVKMLWTHKVQPSESKAFCDTDVSRVVWTLINNGKLTNQITRLVAIVVKFNLHACQLSNLKIKKKTCNPLVIIQTYDYTLFQTRKFFIC